MCRPFKELDLPIPESIEDPHGEVWDDEETRMEGRGQGGVGETPMNYGGDRSLCHDEEQVEDGEVRGHVWAVTLGILLEK